MRERPIIFSGPMVRAILEGRKTQTRRVVKPQPDGEFLGPKMYHPSVTDRRGCMRPGPKQFGIFDTCGEWSIQCPYGAIGDRPWVRESWCHRIEDGRFAYNADGNLDSSCVWYRADGVDVQRVDGDGFCEYNKDGSAKSPWVSPIHMPRWASRITLEITDVRVERLCDITEDDAREEGAELYCRGYTSMSSFRWGFEELWNAINGADSWLNNPWVWVISFKRVDK